MVHGTEAGWKENGEKILEREPVKPTAPKKKRNAFKKEDPKKPKKKGSGLLLWNGEKRLLSTSKLGDAASGRRKGAQSGETFRSHGRGFYQLPGGGGFK